MQLDDFEEEEDVVVLNQEEGEASADTEKLSEVEDKLPQHVLVLPLYAMLPEREQLLMYLYYESGHNLRQIAEHLGVSESRVCQLHGRAIRQIRKLLGEAA